MKCRNLTTVVPQKHKKPLAGFYFSASNKYWNISWGGPTFIYCIIITVLKMICTCLISWGCLAYVVQVAIFWTPNAWVLALSQLNTKQMNTVLTSIKCKNFHKIHRHNITFATRHHIGWQSHVIGFPVNAIYQLKSFHYSLKGGKASHGLWLLVQVTLWSEVCNWGYREHIENEGVLRKKLSKVLLYFNFCCISVKVEFHP